MRKTVLRRDCEYLVVDELVPTFTKVRSFHAQIHDQGRGGVKDVLVTVKKQRSDQPLEVAFCQDCIRTNNARQKQCQQPPRLIRECCATKKPTSQAHHRSFFELSSTHLKISSVNSISSINNNEVDDNTLIGEELLSIGVNSNVSHTSKFADCRGHDFRSPTTVTACQFAQST